MNIEHLTALRERVLEAETVYDLRRCVASIIDDFLGKESEILDSQPWYPMDSAPRDGTVILMLFDDGHVIRTNWLEKHEKWAGVMSHWTPTAWRPVE
jgi:hypothetical protein